MIHEEILEVVTEHFNGCNPFPLEGRLETLILAGSRGYNLHTEDSDYDLLGVVSPPEKYVYGLHTWDGWHPSTGAISGGLDVKLYSMDKFFRLLLKANPNILEVLWTPEQNRLEDTYIMQKIRRNRLLFSTKQAWMPFRGVIHSMRSRMDGVASTRQLGSKRKAAIKKYGYNPKDGFRMAHLATILPEFLQSGKFPVRLEEKDDLTRQTLLAIKGGVWDKEAVLRYVSDYECVAEKYLDVSPLPDTPDMEAIDDLLLWAKENSWY